MCMWGLGVGLPQRVTAMGGKFLFDDEKETPEVLTSSFLYPAEKKMIQFEVRHWCTNQEDGAAVGNIFYGSEGYMVVKGYNRFEIFLGPRREKGPARESGGDHFANFLKAVRSRKTSDQNGPVETAHLSSALAHLGMAISRRPPASAGEAACVRSGDGALPARRTGQCDADAKVSGAVCGSGESLMPAIVIPDDFPAVMGPSQAYRALTERTAVRYYDTLPGSEAGLVERIREAEVVINIRSSCRFTESVFAQCGRLRLLSLWGTGTDNVDLEAAARHGITVTNTPGVAAISIAEHCLGLLLAAARRIPRSDAEVRQGRWPRGEGSQLGGKTLGIVGLGAIGRRFAQLGAAIGMRVIAWTMHPNPALGFELVSLERLLAESDVVSLHLRLSEQTRGMIGAAEFARMKPSAILINTARGPIVNEAAMVEALSLGRIAAAGLDVFEVSWSRRLRDTR